MGDTTRAFDQKLVRQRRVRWLVGVVVIWALVEGGYAVGAALGDEQGHGSDLEVAGRHWADLKQCLVGDASMGSDRGNKKLARLRLGLELAGPESPSDGDAAAFPTRCAPYSQSLSGALVGSSAAYFVADLETLEATLKQGEIDEGFVFSLAWTQLDALLPAAEADVSVPLPPSLPTQLVPISSVTSLGDESIEHTVRWGDPSNGGPLTLRFEKTARTCVFSEDLRSARCVFDHDSLPHTTFRSPRVGSTEQGAPWLSYRDYARGEKLYDVTTGEVLFQSKTGGFFESVLASQGAHWIVEGKPAMRLVRRNGAGEVDEWPLPPNMEDVQIVADFLLGFEPNGALGSRLVARRLPKESGGLGHPETVVARPFALSSTMRWAARRGADTLHLVVDAPTNKLLFTHKEGKWSETEVDDLPDRAAIRVSDRAVQFTWVEPTYVGVMTCRDAGCQKTSYEAELGYENAAVALGEMVALLSWTHDDVRLTLAKPDALARAPRRLLLAADYVSAARLWARGDKALAVLDTNWGTLPIAFDASGDVWPVKIEDGAVASKP